MVQWLDSESFLLDSTADIRQVYSFLKKKPESAKFIFKKYKALQPTIKELCDPDNPLYLDAVKSTLQDIVVIEDAKDDLKSLQERIGFLGRERDKLQATVDEKVKEFDDIEEKLKAARKEEESYNRQKANIRTDHALELIGKNLSDVDNFLKSLVDKWNERLKANPFETGLRLEKDNLSHISLLLTNITELEAKLKTEDFLSSENLEAYHKELLEKAKQEKELMENEIRSYMQYNPKKVITKAMDQMGTVLDKMEKAEVMGDGYYMTRFFKGNVIAELEEAYQYLSNLKDQVENIERKRK